jgi:transposase
MVYYSEKYAKKQKADRERAIAKAMSLIANPGQYTQSTCYGAAAYVKNLRFIKGTGEIADGSILSLDLERISEEEKYDGYYAIVTSEKKMSDAEIRNKYRGLWEIEESFRIMKSEFKSRPAYLSRQDRLKAHFLTCFLALVIYRYLEKKIDSKYTSFEIIETLQNMNLTLKDDDYIPNYTRTELTDLLHEKFDFRTDYEIIREKNIKKIINQTKK